ncbi:hypothetical protein SAMN02745244_03650 [Tessaracoccus bendigoensis DSM 12906]|uniref:Uncharacterized protein n=1 Tax=Tessaracoccus bendigoensis DSM 12906 TaxID=1123357 RepID=A0A1M6NIZ2_9ACTN|nr:hypothetical protein SAMN02745244_03650 [Tessaracoccus bendigoensis DSM 12906]
MGSKVSYPISSATCFMVASWASSIAVGFWRNSPTVIVFGVVVVLGIGYVVLSRAS